MRENNYMRYFFALSALVGLIGSNATAAPADTADLALVTAKVTDAAANVSSFVVTMQLNGTTGVGGTITFVRPMRIKSIMKIGQMGVETYVVDGTVYIHSPYAGWQKMTSASAVNSATALNIAAGLKSTHVTLLPDRQAAGKSVGVMQLETPIPSGALAGGPASAGGMQKLICTYDKLSYRMQTCASSTMTATYSKYNDPANVVELPPDAKNAVPIVISTPATQSSPSPAASGAAATPPGETPAPAGPTSTPLPK